MNGKGYFQVRKGLWRRGHLLSILSLFLPLLGGTLDSPAQAVWFELTPEQIQQAVAWGKDQLQDRLKKGLPIDEYEKEWEMDLGPGKGSAYLNTPFGTISYESRKYAGIKMELPKEEIDSLLLRFKNKLSFSMKLYGKDRYFAKKYKVILEVGEKKIEPTYKDIFKGRESKLADPEAAYESAYTVEFPVQEVDPQSRVTLVATGSEGKEIHFPFDLSKMR